MQLVVKALKSLTALWALVATGDEEGRNSELASSGSSITASQDVQLRREEVALALSVHAFIGNRPTDV